MIFNNININKDLVPKNYLKLATDAQKTRETKIKELMEKRKLPTTGWSDDLIEYLVKQLSFLDSNNFGKKIGMGEREARIASRLVAQRHYNFGHGIGRSGDLLAAQPKAVGSSLLAKLTNALILDLIQAQGILSCQACFIIPMSTGMSLTLCMLSLRKERPRGKYVLWSRIDQKSCFKSITTAGLTPIIIDTVESHCENVLCTDIKRFETLCETMEPDEIVCILSTSSCFAPRNCDDLQGLAQLAQTYKIPHIVNNAYGLQSTYLTHQLQQAHKNGRIDLFVQSTDKNLMVPVGGAIIAGFHKDQVNNVAKSYAGRASSSQLLDVFITLLTLGKKGYSNLVKERKCNFIYLRKKLEIFANELNFGRVLNVSMNPISLAVIVYSSSPLDDITELGSMLFTRGVSGARIITRGSTKNIDGYNFSNWGMHSDCHHIDQINIFTVAASLGISTDEIDMFIVKLKDCWLDIQKRNRRVK